MSDVRAWLASLSPQKRDYALKHTPSHLAKAGKAKQLHRCLTDFDFIEAKVSALRSQALIDDYDLPVNLDASLSGEKAESLVSVVNTLAVTPEGKWVITGSDDNSLKVWNLETKEELFTLKDHTSSVKSLALTPDSKWVISGSYDHTIKVWNLDKEKELFPFKGHIDQVNTVAVTPDGKWVISGSYSTKKAR